MEIPDPARAGRLPAFPAYAFYAASKHAIGALSESLSAEVAPFGIRVVCIEPGYFDTALSDTVDSLIEQVDDATQGKHEERLKAKG